MENKSNISYEGIIKVRTFKKGKLYSQRIFKNKGRWPLFTFFTNCLAGNYKAAEQYRPYYLALFSVPYTKTENTKVGFGGNPSDLILDYPLTDTDNLEEYNKISYYLDVDTKKNSVFITQTGDSPTIKTLSNYNIGSSYITFSFRIPFTKLTLSREDTGWQNPHGPDKKEVSYVWNPINLIALYSKKYIPNTEGTIDEPSAYAFIPFEGYSDYLGSIIDEATYNENISEYSLAIDWTLNLSNN